MNYKLGSEILGECDSIWYLIYDIEYSFEPQRLFLETFEMFNSIQMEYLSHIIFFDRILFDILHLVSSTIYFQKMIKFFRLQFRLLKTILSYLRQQSWQRADYQ